MEFSDYYQALASTTPDVVSINTYPETHFAYAKAALEAGCHVFCEKPLAESVAQAQELVDLARARDRKLVIGYILRVHPAWQKFIEIARTLGKPLVMRMNLNQQSHGAGWQQHRNLMASMSPIVDCGVHYVDVMCQMTGAKPVRVSAVGARLTDEIKPDMYNYGALQVAFADGSVGWYEAGWGPMMSEVAFFVKDVIGPKGAVSIVKDPNAESATGSNDIDSHTKTNCIRLHHSETTAAGEFAKPDELINTADEPDHQALCDREQGVPVARDSQERGTSPTTCRMQSAACGSCSRQTKASVPDKSWQTVQTRLQLQTRPQCPLLDDGPTADWRRCHPRQRPAAPGDRRPCPRPQRRSGACPPNRRIRRGSVLAPARRPTMPECGA